MTTPRVLVPVALGTNRDGDLADSVDPRREAEFLTATVLGLFVMLRATAPPTAIQSAVRVATDHLESLRAPST